MTNITRRTRIVPSTDSRDIPGGSCVGMGLVFEVEGEAGRIVWSVNTGWVARPIVTPTMVPGAQKRAEQPGVDKHLAQNFPQPLSVAVIHAGSEDFESEVNDGWFPGADSHSWVLLDALVTEGEPAVFEKLEAIYQERFATATA